MCPFGKVQAFYSDKVSIQLEKENPHDYWLADDISLLSLLNTNLFTNPGVNFVSNSSNHFYVNNIAETEVNQHSRSLFPQSFSQRQTNEKAISFLNEDPIEVFISENLQIKNYNKKIMTAKMFVVLFRTWGNVRRVVVSRKNKTAFVIYDSQISAKSACTNLNNFRLFDAYLDIRFISYVHPKYSPNSSTKNIENFLYEQKLESLQYINPTVKITPLLKISNASNYLNKLKLQMIISEFCNPKTIQMIQRSSVDSYVVTFGDVYESVKVLMMIHGLRVDDKFISAIFIQENIPPQYSRDENKILNH